MCVYGARSAVESTLSGPLARLLLAERRSDTPPAGHQVPAGESGIGACEGTFSLGMRWNQVRLNEDTSHTVARRLETATRDVNRARVWFEWLRNPPLSLSAWTRCDPGHRA